jgi:hypothetical protein
MQPGWQTRRLGTALISAAVVVPLLLVGGALVHGAVSAPGAPLSVSVSETGTGQGVPAPRTPSDDNATTPIGSAEQAISVSVLPGPLTEAPSTESLSFTRISDGSWQAPLSTVTVVDARGSLVGWQATLTLQSLSGFSPADLARARLCVHPGAALAVSGRQSEVRAGKDACGSLDDPRPLFFAPPNGGGGTFDDTGQITLRLPSLQDTGSITATLGVAVH